MRTKANALQRTRQDFEVKTLSGEQLHRLQPHAGSDYLVINLGQAEKRTPAFNETVRIAISAAMTAVLASLKQQASVPEAVVTTPSITVCPDAARTERNAQRREALNARIFADAIWLLARELSEKANFKSSNPSAGPNRWKLAGKIFAIQHNGKDYFPEYALDEGYRPLPVVKEVMALFGGSKTPWGLAIWFGSENSWLGGRKPRDVLATQPEQVLLAAQAEKEGGIHG